jgi:hypothetical protein
MSGVGPRLPIRKVDVQSPTAGAPRNRPDVSSRPDAEIWAWLFFEGATQRGSVRLRSFWLTSDFFIFKFLLSGERERHVAIEAATFGFFAGGVPARPAGPA